MKTTMLLFLLSVPAFAGTPISSLPFSITEPGSYYLTGNLAGRAGISITANDVVLDLKGFELKGAGIVAAGAKITVRNGAVRNCSGAGIEASRVVNGEFQLLQIAGNG